MSGTTGTIPLSPWIDDQLITKETLNAENVNIGSLMDAAGCGGHSDTDADAQIQTAPYPGSVLSKATSIAGELERLRYQLTQVLGTDYWYKPAAIDLTSAKNVVVPVGGVIDYPTNTSPNSGWHLADGTAISRAGYPALFSLIGTTFGIGDGTTTFNLPDYRDRMSIGAGSSYAAGATGGAASVNLAHTHSISGHDHAVSLTTGVPDDTIGAASAGSPAVASTTHHHTVSGNTGNSGTLTTDSKLSSPQSILNPYLAMHKMIRVL